VVCLSFFFLLPPSDNHSNSFQVAGRQTLHWDCVRGARYTAENVERFAFIGSILQYMPCDRGLAPRHREDLRAGRFRLASGRSLPKSPGAIHHGGARPRVCWNDCKLPIGSPRPRLTPTSSANSAISRRVGSRPTASSPCATRRRRRAPKSASSINSSTPRRPSPWLE
jgi:hypothetical protein